MEESKNYRWMRLYFKDYIKEYPEFESLTDGDINDIFTEMLEQMYHIASTYLDDEEE